MCNTVALYSGHVFEWDKRVQSVSFGRSLCLSPSIMQTKVTEANPERRYHNGQRTENMDEWGTFIWAVSLKMSLAYGVQTSDVDNCDSNWVRVAQSAQWLR